ncbi:hypothetical protein H9X85_03790 [Anaerotignum lactatifermentans]|uniref:RNA polymerase sigma factor 70 region 4 type 2 domain-containing protein n=1 Tax=Anaerotignum lactatifermentans TaxID=160404 RepID=A0ABS2G7S5_9FIRM|nr:sigma factor-like helix-turn-helix DNA-binding protein [Anaerotignum lactatifermentans]MBM6828753.1 hypothetical protein [Anaerotignum lactatifermentans]MBM6877080.1 hypothetical protein [Anaerotignum lactatifermentans]MBM6950335.1 hypothetical protein [Anaerotignum lactatifermentans]
MGGKMHAFLEKEAASPKGQMKRKLLHWGGAMEICARKQEEIRRLLRLREDCAAWEEEEGKVLGERYENETKRLQEEIERVLAEKADMDRQVDRLPPEEQQMVYLRYVKGYGYDYIAMKKHMSRATCFRVLDRALEFLLEEEG